MSIQSPKSRRAHAPGEKPASDGNPQPRTGGQTGPAKGVVKTSKVPKHSPYGHHGSPNRPGYESVPTHKAEPPSGGSPGYQGENSETRRKGGTSHQFPNGSG